MLPTKQEALDWYFKIIEERDMIPPRYILFELFLFTDGPGWVYSGYCFKLETAQKRARKHFTQTCAFAVDTGKCTVYYPRGG